METENRKLSQQVKEMTKFLADYGLTWIGDAPNDNAEVQKDEGPGEGLQKTEEGDAKSSGMWHPEKAVAVAKPAPSGPAPLPDEFEFDMKVLQARVAELNIVAGEGKCDVAKNKKGEKHTAERVRSPPARALFASSDALCPWRSVVSDAPLSMR